MGETRPSGAVVAADTRRVAPAVVEAVALGRLAVTETLKALEHHDHGDDTRRYRTPTLVVEDVGKRLIGEEPVTFAVQEGVDRLLVEHSHRRTWLRRRAGHLVCSPRPASWVPPPRELQRCKSLRSGPRTRIELQEPSVRAWLRERHHPPREPLFRPSSNLRQVFRQRF